MPAAIWLAQHGHALGPLAIAAALAVIVLLSVGLDTD